MLHIEFRNCSSLKLARAVGSVAALVAVCATMVLPASAQTVTATVPTGSGPDPVVVNPVTNKIYVLNQVSNNVTVIDGASNTTTTVAVGTSPESVALNSVTNKIYVANLISNNVTVIDGATYGTTTVAAGTNPIAVAVNSVTNKIYVANQNSNNVTVIDGATNSTTIVAVGIFPAGVAVNSVTNKIYVTNYNSNNVTIIDGATNSTTTVAAGTNPQGVVVNTVTNKIYVGNPGSNDVTVIDGVTNATATVAVGTLPWGLAVNSVTNKIYVGNEKSNNVTVIDGTTNATATVSVGNLPAGLALNTVTNKIWVVNYNSSDVTVIDGATNGTTTVAVGSQPWYVAVNSVTDRTYVANYGSNTVTVIGGAGATAATTTALASSANPSMFGSPVTFTATVTTSGSNTPTGAVTFKDGTTTLATVPLNSIAYVNGTTASTGSPATGAISLTVNYASTAGNSLFLSITADATISSVKDSNNVTWTLVQSAYNLGMYLAYVINSPAISSVTITQSSFSGNDFVTAALGEYSGVGAVVSTNVNTENSVSGTPWTVTLDGMTCAATPSIGGLGYPVAVALSPTLGSTNWMIAGGGWVNNNTSPTFAALTGNLRASSPPVEYPIVTQPPIVYSTTLLMDNITPGVATYTTSTLAVGQHSITAVYGGDGYNAGSTSAVLTETINSSQATTTTGLASSANPVTVGSSVTFTATVTTSGSNTPTGTVTFKDGTTTLATGTLNGSGVATYTTSTLAVGQHSITAVYGGDANNAGSTSAVLTETVNAADFAFSSNPTSAMVVAGQSGTFTLTITPQGSFTNPISFTCTGLPAMSNYAFSPASVTPNSSTATTTLTITTAAHTALLVPSAFDHRWLNPLYAIWLTLVAMMLGAAGLPELKRRKLLRYISVCLLACTCLLQVGCALSGSGGKGGTPSGTYTVTITGAAGSTQHNKTVTLTVQ
jgi:YVTN family beta-propeller protein